MKGEVGACYCHSYKERKLQSWMVVKELDDIEGRQASLKDETMAKKFFLYFATSPYRDASILGTFGEGLHWPRKAKCAHRLPLNLKEVWAA